MITRILSYVCSHFWAIDEDTGQAMLQILQRRAEGVLLSRADIEATVSAAMAARPTRDATPVTRGAGVAVIPIFGLLSHRAHMVRDLSGPGGTSTELTSHALQQALANPEVSSIVLDVSSPGGSVEGVLELAAEIRAGRAQKPIVAVANAMAASGAYWIASQATELAVTPSGAVGSIGVYGIHRNEAKALEAAGIELTVVSAGRCKTEGFPTGPLSDEARDYRQGQVNAIYERFLGDVAVGRGVQVDRVRDTFGEGRMVLADEAVARGMADRVATLGEVIADLLDQSTTASPPRAAQSAEPHWRLARLARAAGE